MISLRRRLLIGLISSFTIMAVLAGVVAYVLDRNEVNLSLDGQLRQLALNVGDTNRPAAVDSADNVTLDPEDEFVIAIWDESGHASQSDPSVILPRPATSGFAYAHLADEDWRTYSLVNRSRVIEVAQRVVVREESATNSAIRALLPVVLLIPV